MKKILFFDDEPFITMYIIKNLQENYGWKGDKEITFVSTVDELLDEIIHNDRTYNLFVLDVMASASMPSKKIMEYFLQEELNDGFYGMSIGLVLAKKIRGMEKYKNVPILFYTARRIPPIPESEKEITTYIMKPASAGEISLKMNDLLETK